jgi:hypothetical protein
VKTSGASLLETLHDMDLLKVFRLEQWDAQEVSIGRHTVLSYDLVTPKATVKAVVWAAGPRLFHMSASNSYCERVAERILDCAERHYFRVPDARKIAVIPADFSPVASFDNVVIVAPEVNLFAHLSEPLENAIYLVAPAYKSEFTNGMSVKDFRHQIGRKDGWRVYIYRWNRPEKTSPSWD